MEESYLDWYEVKGGKEARYQGAYVQFMYEERFPWFASKVSVKATGSEDDAQKHKPEGFKTFGAAIAEIESWDMECIIGLHFKEDANDYDQDYIDVFENEKGILSKGTYLKVSDGAVSFDLNAWEWYDGDEDFDTYGKREGKKGFILDINFFYKD